MNVGEKIILLRRRKGLNRSELGRLLGVSTSAVFCWENGLHKPGLPSLQVISAALGVEPNYLMDDSQVEPPAPREEWIDEFVAKGVKLGREEAFRRLDMVEA